MATFEVVSHTSAVRTATKTTVTITKPTGTISGNVILVAFQFYGKGRASTYNNLGGFTNYQRGAITHKRKILSLVWYTKYRYTTVVKKTIVVTEWKYHTTRLVTTVTLSWRVTWRPAATAPTSWSCSATFVVMVALRYPAGFTVIASTGFETLVTETANSTTATVKVDPGYANDIVFVFGVQGVAGNTITLPAGTTSLATTTTHLSAGIGYLVPGLGTHTETVTMSASATLFVAALVMTDGVPPPAPTLALPAATAVLAVTTGVTFTAAYNNPTGSPQNAYALRLRTATALTWTYWNASTLAFQSTIVWNATATTVGKTFSVTIAHTDLANNKEYVWSLAARTAAVSKDGSFATTATFTTAQVPTVTVSAPTGSDIGTAHPLVTFTWTSAPTFTLTTARVKVFTAAQHSAPGFTPSTSAAYWDSGTIA